MLEEHDGDPTLTARREVFEETGFSVGNPELLFAAYVSPGSITERLHYYIAPYTSADRTAPGGGLIEEGEEIEVLEVRIDDALRWVTQGKIVDAKTIILLQYVQMHLF